MFLKLNYDEVLNTTKLSKHFQRGQKNKITQARTVVTSNCRDKNKTSIFFLCQVCK